MLLNACKHYWSSDTAGFYPGYTPEVGSVCVYPSIIWMLMIMVRCMGGDLSSSGFMWLTLALQLRQGLVHFNNVLHHHHRTCPDYPDSTVRCFFVDLNVLAHSYPNRAYAITMKNKLFAGILYAISAAEFCTGCYMFIRAAVKPREQFLWLSIKYALPTSKNPWGSFRCSSLSVLVGIPSLCLLHRSSS